MNLRLATMAWVMGKISKYLRDAGINGRTIDASYVRGVLPGNVVTYGAPTGQIDIGDANAEGTAGAATRTDHQHSSPAPGAGYPIDVDETAEADGTATTPARSDHRHALGVHGPSKHTNRTRSLYFGASVISSGRAAPAQANIADNSAYPTNAFTLLNGAAYGVSGEFIIPSDWASGTISMLVHFTHIVVGGSGNVVWNLGYILTGDGEDVTAAKTAPGGVAVAAPAEGLRKITAMGGSLTVAAGKVVEWTLERRAADAADTFEDTIRLLGVEFRYTADE